MVNVQLSFQERPFNHKLQFSFNAVYLFLEAVSLQNVKHLSKHAMFLLEAAFLRFIARNQSTKQHIPEIKKKQETQTHTHQKKQAQKNSKTQLSASRPNWDVCWQPTYGNVLLQSPNLDTQFLFGRHPLADR